jgi:signal transduction histidine kinase
MWTRLVAGVAAHDINNAAQGLSNLLTLASRPGTSAEALARYAALARDGLADLRRLAATLGTISEGAPGAQDTRLDLVCADAITETDVPERTVEVTSTPPEVLVHVGGASLRTALSLVLRYCLAASPHGARVLVTIAREEGGGSVAFDAPDAPAPRVATARALDELVGTPERELGGDGGLILAGAITRETGGKIDVSSPAGGLRFKLSFPRAEKATDNARSA